MGEAEETRAEYSPLSPEQRRRQHIAHLQGPWLQRARDICQRVAVGTYTDGFTAAGNFAFLSLLAVFAFFVVAAAIVSAFGRTEVGTEFVAGFLQTLPFSVAEALRDPVEAAMVARTGPLLWLSALVSLWTTTSLIETVRQILNTAYGTCSNRSFWHYRLGSMVLIIFSVFLAMLALSANFLLAGVREFIAAFIPDADAAALILTLSSAFPFLILFGTLYVIFRLLTPRPYRGKRFPKWPGAVFISLWWLAIVTALPWLLRNAANYQLTYGSLAGVIITLIFFYLVGLGMVIGSQLNAALAESDDD